MSHLAPYTVVLSSAGENRIEVMRALRRELRPLTLNDAAKMLGSLPARLGPFNEWQAAAVRDALEAAGAEVEVSPPLLPPPVPMPIPERCLQRLRDAALLVSEPYPPSHTLAERVNVGKPVDVPGNSLPEWGCRWGVNDIVVDAPGVSLWGRDGRWWVEVGAWAPQAPDEFVRSFEDPEAAVQDILDYFFGDPGRMRRMAEWHDPARIRASEEEMLAEDTLDESCRVHGCERNRVRLGVFCPRHHLQMLSGTLDE
jgi:hypothetical protein